MFAEQGVRVVRGRDWRWDEEDGGEGMLGTIVDTRFMRNSKQALVTWDNGSKGCYEVERPGKNEIIAIDFYHNESSGESNCAGCKMKVRGLQWTCITCRDVIVCTSCYMSDFHDVSHRFKRCIKDFKQWDILVPRKNSMKIQSKGLFKGATVTANGDTPSKENPTAAGKIVNYSTQRNFRYCSAHVVWNQSSSNTVHYFGQDRKVNIKCLVAANGGYYYKDHLPNFRAREETKYRSFSMKVTAMQTLAPFNSSSNMFSSLPATTLVTNATMGSPTKKNLHKKLSGKESSCSSPVAENFGDSEKGGFDYYEASESSKEKNVEENDIIELITRASERMQEGDPKIDCYKKASEIILRPKQLKERTAGIVESRVKKNNDMCCLCKTNKCDAETEPCGHTVCCSKCIVYFKRCYECKSNIIGYTVKPERKVSQTTRRRSSTLNTQTVHHQGKQVHMNANVSNVRNVSDAPNVPNRYGETRLVQTSLPCNLCNAYNNPSCDCEWTGNPSDENRGQNSACLFCEQGTQVLSPYA